MAAVQSQPAPASHFHPVQLRSTTTASSAHVVAAALLTQTQLRDQIGSSSDDSDSDEYQSTSSSSPSPSPPLSPYLDSQCTDDQNLSDNDSDQEQPQQQRQQQQQYLEYGPSTLGLRVVPDQYPPHASCCQDDPHPVRTLTAAQCADLYNEAATYRPEQSPERELFPWLHGADVPFSAQAAYFGYPGGKRCPLPRFRGLTLVCADPERSPYNGLARSRSMGVSSASISSTFSIESESSSSSDFFNMDDDSDEMSTSSSTSSLAGPEPRPSLLVSTLFPDEIITSSHFGLGSPARFIKPVMPTNVNLRNFRIQAAKFATISDIVVYSETGATPQALEVAMKVKEAQEGLRRERLVSESEVVSYNVFVVTDPFSVFESDHPELVAVDSNGFARNKINFFDREREEMRLLTQASPIASNVWLGNSQDVPIIPSSSRSRALSSDSSSSLSMMDDGNPHGFCICVEAHDQAVMADSQILNHSAAHLDFCEEEYRTSMSDDKDAGSTDYLRPAVNDIVHLDCLSTGQACVQPGSQAVFLDRLVEHVRWLHQQANPTEPNKLARRVLIQCADGYTESSVLALSYIMYDQACSLPDAYLHLQLKKERSFFVYPADVEFLQKVEQRFASIRNGPVTPKSKKERRSSQFNGCPMNLLKRSSSVAAPPPSPSPALPSTSSQAEAKENPRHTWFHDARFDGHFPSRILPFLYLGNLNHAGNASMLKELGITHVVSVGESALVPPRESHSFPLVGNSSSRAARQGRASANSLWHEHRMGRIQVLDLKGVSDDGIDPIRPYLDEAIDFIEQARQGGGKVLVHCRVGVSRSATVVIAYVMKWAGLDLPSAYLLTRSKRLNILIQPNLRLFFELHQLELDLAAQREKEATLPSGIVAALNGERPPAMIKPLSWSFLAREIASLNERYLC